MLERFNTNSIRFRMTAATVGIAVLLLATLIFCFAYSTGMIRTQVYTTYQSILSTYIHGMDNNLEDVESFLTSVVSENADIHMLNTFEDGWSLAAYRQQKDLSDAIVTYSMADGFFIYAPEQDMWVDATVSNYPGSHRRAVREYISGNIRDSACYQQLKKWGVVCIADEYVFFRILRAQGCYVGAWVRAGTITEEFKWGELSHTGHVLLAGDSSHLYDTALQDLKPDPVAAAQRYQMASGYITIAQRSDRLNAYLVLLLKDDSVTRDLDHFIVIMALLSCCALAAVGLLVFVSYRFLVKPLNRLTGAMQVFQDGNWDIRLPEQTELDEFADINATFNHMVEQVESLKIDVYEQKNEKLYIENQMLKQQMAPHTLINCLNTIHGLAGSGKTALVQKLAEDLGRHLRYLLSGNQTVLFRQEMDHARNYVDICNIRYGNGIVLDEQISPEVMHAYIPPLMIHGFVENSVKYALSPERQTHMGIRAWREGDRLRLQMWDDGPGYDEEMLRKLERPQNIVTNSGYRIGLVNLCRRAQLLYGDRNAGIRFSNRPEGGAYMDVSIPYRMTEGRVE